MRAVTATVSSAHPTALVRLDNYATAVLGGAVVCSGGGAFTLFHSSDDPNDLVSPVPVSSMAWDNSLLPTAARSGSASTSFQIMACPLWFQLNLQAAGPLQTIFLTNTALTTWTVPSDWNNTNNSIECIGGGGGGAAAYLTAYDGAGGGGGEYRKAVNVVLTPNASVPIQIGQGGTGGSSLAPPANLGTSGTATIFNTNMVIANGGKAPTTVSSPWPGGVGGTGGTGAAANNDGGAGGANNETGFGGSGGGGAGGPAGVGGAGGVGGPGGTGQSSGAGGGGAQNGATGVGVMPTTTAGGAGGPSPTSAGGAGGVPGGSNAAAGTNGSGGGGGGGGALPQGNGAAGGAGTDWAATAGGTAGPGGGGGGGGGSSPSPVGVGGVGGLYGGGGGGGASAGSGTSAAGGNGAQGIIIIKYVSGGVGSVRATFLQVGEHSHSNISKGPYAPPHIASAGEPGTNFGAMPK